MITSFDLACAADGTAQWTSVESDQVGTFRYKYGIASNPRTGYGSWQTVSPPSIDEALIVTNASPSRIKYYYNVLVEFKDGAGVEAENSPMEGWFLWDPFGDCPSTSSLPDADFSQSVSSGTVPCTVQFTDTSTGGAPTAWKWDFGDGKTSTAENPSHEYVFPGEFTVTLRVENAFGSSHEIVVDAVEVTCGSEPTIGTATLNGASSTIAGCNFGVKSPAAPLVWDSLESGAVVGLPISANNADWNKYADTLDPEWSDDWAHGGTYSAKAPDRGMCFLYPEGIEPSAELYMTNWIYSVGIDLNEFHANKGNRINSSEDAGGGGVYNGAGCNNFGKGGSSMPQPPKVWPETSLGMEYNPSSTQYVANAGSFEFEWNTEQRLEAYVKVSSAGTANGTNIGGCVGVGADTLSAIVNRAAGETWLVDTALFGLGQTCNPTCGVYDVYIDDLYVDNTRARIELGNASVFEDCTHREIQIPSSWYDTGITFTYNPGSFGSSETVYLFVVNADGEVSNGYEVVTP